MEIFHSLFTNEFVLLSLMILGGLAFLISVITEVTKNLGFLKRIPTDLQVIVLSILLCQVSYFGYISSFKIQFEWYYCAAAFMASFIVAFVAMYGWEKLTTLYKRFKSHGGK